MLNDHYLLCKKIARHGGLKKNQHVVHGRNSRLDNIQAGILNIKLKKLSKWIHIRNKQSDFYKQNLHSVGDISFIQQDKNSIHSNHLLVIKTKYRTSLQNYLNKKKIYTNIHYPKCLPELPIFKKKHYHYCKSMKAVLENKKILSLPIGEHLNKKQLDYTCYHIQEFFKNA